jgi:hypothetical protein
MKILALISKVMTFKGQISSRSKVVPIILAQVNMFTYFGSKIS